MVERYPLFGQDDAGTVTLKNVPIQACLPPAVLAQLSSRLWVEVLQKVRVKIKFYNTIYHVLRTRLPVRNKDVRIPFTLATLTCTAAVCALPLTWQGGGALAREDHSFPREASS